jgi:hypothetical protein
MGRQFKENWMPAHKAGLLKQCGGCGVYVENYYTTCPACQGTDFPGGPEPCPTPDCDGKKWPKDEYCSGCTTAQALSPRPKSWTAA